MNPFARPLAPSMAHQAKGVSMNSTQPEKPMERLRTHIRWTIRADMQAILEIENESFEYPWSEDDFVRFYRGRNSLGYTALNTN
jgi:hypothetical protein